MPCSLTAPSNLKQCWLIIGELLWYSSWGYTRGKCSLYLSLIWVQRILIYDYGHIPQALMGCVDFVSLVSKKSWHQLSILCQNLYHVFNHYNSCAQCLENMYGANHTMFQFTIGYCNLSDQASMSNISNKHKWVMSSLTVVLICSSHISQLHGNVNDHYTHWDLSKSILFE